MKILLVLSLALFFGACKNKTVTPVEPQSPAVVSGITEGVKKTPFTERIEQAHKMKAFLAHEAVQYDIELAFGGNPRLNATISQATDGSKIKIDYKDGGTVYFNGTNVYGYPKETDFKGARFDIFTWSYFFALPYKLNDPGTAWGTPANYKWGDVDYLASKLTFGAEVGDTPEDWYVVYKNPATHMLEGAAYIVSFGKELAKAEANPHAIKFENFTTVEGVPFATKWTFHNWSLDTGYTDVLGEGKITNIKFADAPAAFFTKPPADAVLLNMPQD